MSDLVDRAHHLYETIFPSEQLVLAENGPPELELGGPVLVVSPSTEDQVSEAFKLASTEGLRVVPIGSGSAMHFGNLPVEADILLSTARLDATVNFEPRDLTVVVQAGRRLASLQEELAEAGQTLALDPPNAEQTTIGGMLSTNLSGPLRRSYGTPRDLCLGIRAVLADGTPIRGGGRVVKNVAGYDLPRLFIGSHGTLGVIVEAAFRLHPPPAAEAGVLGVYPSWERATEAAHRLTHSELLPRSMELLDLHDAIWGDNGADGPSPAVFVCFGDVADSVAYQTDRAESLLNEAGATRIDRLDGDDTRSWQALLRGALHAASREPSTVVCKAGTVMTSVLAALDGARRFAGPSQVGVQSMAHYTDGVAYSLLRLPTPYEPGTVADAVEGYRKEVMAFGGRLVVESAPGDVKRLLDVWGAPTGPLGLMQRLKDRFDPHHLLNRGRFVRGLDDGPVAEAVSG